MLCKHSRWDGFASSTNLETMVCWDDTTKLWVGKSQYLLQHGGISYRNLTNSIIASTLDWRTTLCATVTFRIYQLRVISFQKLWTQSDSHIKMDWRAKKGTMQPQSVMADCTHWYQLSAVLRYIHKVLFEWAELLLIRSNSLWIYMIL